MKLTLNTFKIPAIFITAGIFLFGANSFAANKSSSNKDSDKTTSLFGDLREHSVGIGMGQTILHGDMNNIGQDKITADLYYNYSASYSFGLMINLHYSDHELRDEKITNSGLTTGVKMVVFQYDSFAPYVFGGVGFYRPVMHRKAKNGKVVRSDGKWTFGNNFGAGADLKLNNKFTFGLMFHHHNPFDVKQDFGAEVEGSYTKLLLQLMYTF
jgi:hypothetical protein